jgi:hypothetical protein
MEYLSTRRLLLGARAINGRFMKWHFGQTAKKLRLRAFCACQERAALLLQGVVLLLICVEGR